MNILSDFFNLLHLSIWPVFPSLWFLCFICFAENLNIFYTSEFFLSSKCKGEDFPTDLCSCTDTNRNFTEAVSPWWFSTIPLACAWHRFCPWQQQTYLAKDYLLKDDFEVTALIKQLWKYIGSSDSMLWRCSSSASLLYLPPQTYYLCRHSLV